MLLRSPADAPAVAFCRRGLTERMCCRGTPGRVEQGQTLLITQRSQFKSCPRYQEAAGQKPDRRMAVRLFDRLLAVRWRDGTPECGIGREDLAEIGIVAAVAATHLLAAAAAVKLGLKGSAGVGREALGLDCCEWTTAAPRQGPLPPKRAGPGR